MKVTISDAISQLLRIVAELHSAYPKKRFTLDGRLVGDIGEVLVEEEYDIKLHENLQRHHDGITSDGRHVQIKATMQDSLTFPADHIPDYYIGIKIRTDGEFIEIFNGPGSLAWEAVKNRKPTKTNLHTVSTKKLQQLDKEVRPKDKIPRRLETRKNV